MTQTFEKRQQLPVSSEEAFAWHERPGALSRLIPPWESVSVVKKADTLEEGSVVELEQRLGPLRLHWKSRHHDFVCGTRFRDSQLSGPFSRWEHLHEFAPADKRDQSGHLRDLIEYELPGGFVGRWLGGSYVRRKIASMFRYRHRTTCDDLTAHAKHSEAGLMNIAVTGTSGLVGSSLVPMLTTGGHQVVKLVRRDPAEGEVQWDPSADEFDASSLDGIDAVVHLAGKGIASGRWNEKLKNEIRKSRVDGTRVLCEGLARMASPPKTLVCASAIGFYGERGDELLTEESAAGEGFLSEVSQAWEESSQPAREAGIRVVNVRFGVILSPKDGALAKMLLPFKLGGGGRVGNGRQYWSWISIDDAVGAIHHAIMSESVSGPLNAVAPNPVTNKEFTKTLGKVLRRPTILPMPAFAARLALGEMANDLMLTSTRVEPGVLEATGYEFRQPTLEEALRHLLGKTSD